MFYKHVIKTAKHPLEGKLILIHKSTRTTITTTTNFFFKTGNLRLYNLPQEVYLCILYVQRKILSKGYTLLNGQSHQMIQFKFLLELTLKHPGMRSLLLLVTSN